MRERGKAWKNTRSFQAADVFFCFLFFRGGGLIRKIAVSGKFQINKNGGDVLFNFFEHIFFEAG